MTIYLHGTYSYLFVHFSIVTFCKWRVMFANTMHWRLPKTVWLPETIDEYEKSWSIRKWFD